MATNALTRAHAHEQVYLPTLAAIFYSTRVKSPKHWHRNANESCPVWRFLAIAMVTGDAFARGSVSALQRTRSPRKKPMREYFPNVKEDCNCITATRMPELSETQLAAMRRRPRLIAKKRNVRQLALASNKKKAPIDTALRIRADASAARVQEFLSAVTKIWLS